MEWQIIRNYFKHLAVGAVIWVRFFRIHMASEYRNGVIVF
jgi:hypothetical protein